MSALASSNVRTFAGVEFAEDCSGVDRKLLRAFMYARRSSRARMLSRESPPWPRGAMVCRQPGCRRQGLHRRLPSPVCSQGTLSWLPCAGVSIVRCRRREAKPPWQENGRRPPRSRVPRRSSTYSCGSPVRASRHCLAKPCPWARLRSCTVQEVRGQSIWLAANW